MTITDARLGAIREHLNDPGVREFSCTMVSHNELSALLARLDAAEAAVNASIPLLSVGFTAEDRITARHLVKVWRKASGKSD